MVSAPRTLFEKKKGEVVKALEEVLHKLVAHGFKDKTRYTPYVSSRSQITHMTTNEGNIKR
jgi:hypothetical protein